MSVTLFALLSLASQAISRLFSFVNVVNGATVAHLEKLGVSVSQSTSEILSRHPSSQMNHLLEPPQFAVMGKATSLPPPPNPKDVPAFGEEPAYLKLPLMDCIW